MDHDDGGLQGDLGQMVALGHLRGEGVSRREALRWVAGVAMLPLVPKLMACGDDARGGDVTDTSVADTGADTSVADTGVDSIDVGDVADTGFDTLDTTTPESCRVIPAETAGPYPGDGSNGPNILTEVGVVRRDIRGSIGAMSGVADGVPLTVRLRLVSTTGACGSLAGYAIYVWHCDREAEYSIYTLTTENYLRGVQATDGDGFATFTTIFPGCYAGRWPHIHFEVYPSLEETTTASQKVRTSQLAFPEDVCDAVYATAGYEASKGNLAGISLATDGVFRDGVELQMAEVEADGDGYLATLLVGIAT